MKESKEFPIPYARGDEPSGTNVVQKALGAVVILVVVSLFIVIMFSVTAGKEAGVSPLLKLSQSELHPEPKTGKLIWTGTIRNASKASVTAPWAKVTLFDPDGESVDTAEATTTAPTIPAHGVLTYTTIFDTRGNSMRYQVQLEMPNARPLGM